jgi:tetratricopeptide (TPR) repeat protein
MKRHTLLTLICVSWITLSLFAQSNAPSPAEQLRQLTAELQQSPGDDALREKIVKLARTMVPPPALPEEANRRMTRGTILFKEAKNDADFKDAITEFQAAALAAPWYADAYYNLGIAQNKAKDFAAAARSLKLYLIAVPDAPDAKAAQSLIYEMELRQEKADKENTAQAVQQAEQQANAQKQARFYSRFDGGVWRREDHKVTGLDSDVFLPEGRHGCPSIRGYIAVNGHEMTAHDEIMCPNSRDLVEWKTVFTSRSFDLNDDKKEVKVTISEDGDQITAVLAFEVDGGHRVKTRNIYRRIK